ncbi:MAG: DUF1194 domain-containing protein [Paracoccaceae bacterium]
MLKLSALIAGLLLLAPVAGAAQLDGEEVVDIELILAVDVSRSMTPRELEIQRRGYAAALTSDEVVRALTSGPNQQIALTYVEWAGVQLQRTIVDWTLIRSLDDAEKVARTLTIQLSNNLRRTSISAALDHTVRLFDDNGFRGLRKVIDISGDGPNNMGRAVTSARDEALARGVVINGLPLMTREGMGMMWHLDDLDLYYANCVIGGPGAFVIPVRSWAEFAPAIQRKLVLELVWERPRSLPTTVPEVLPARFRGQTAQGYDCLIGEKIWDEIMGNWN